MALMLLGIGLGLFMIAVAVFNWDSWFFDYESRLMELLGGETLVRWWWGLSGVAVICISLYFGLKAL
jgi:hypothetical protein